MSEQFEFVFVDQNIVAFVHYRRHEKLQSLNLPLQTVNSLHAQNIQEETDEPRLSPVRKQKLLNFVLQKQRDVVAQIIVVLKYRVH